MRALPVLRTTDPRFEEQFENRLKRQVETAADIEALVKTILRDVREKGDSALFDYTERFDRVRIDHHSAVAGDPEIADACRSVDPEVLKDIQFAADRIKRFHQDQLSALVGEEKQTASLREVVRPLHRVGLYIPGGKAAYPSSVLMCAIPARVAGVNEITMVSPRVSPQVLAAAKIAGVTKIYRVGGAQAIAALAYGTETIERVDKIVGPGNAYVETAKRLVFGAVGLDMVAGPSEVVILADESGIPSFAAADFIAQAEHDEDAFPVIITTSEEFLTAVARAIRDRLKKTERREIARKSIENNGLLILAHHLDEAMALCNRIAPEHLELMVDNAHQLISDVQNAGAVFLGNYSPVAAGDYLAGPSHVLPTAGTARFFSPLGVGHFLKRMSIIAFSRDELSELSHAISRLATMEGLKAHAEAVEIRVRHNP